MLTIFAVNRYIETFKFRNSKIRMLQHLPFYLAIILAIVLLIMLAQKIKVAYPILLVVAGLIISFIPGTPEVHVDPDLIFLIFLPPLLYESAWSISWKELWRWRRIILSFAFIVVFFTSLAVAVVANSFIPGFSLALGLMLGGIVSPSDAVSTGAILKFVKLPKRFSSILEGESLLNDASSLIIFRFAMIAAATGQFVWHQAALSLVWMCVGGVGIGLLIGFIFIKMHRMLPTDANIDIVLTLITPYVIYLAAQAAQASGVLAVVAGGLFLARRRFTFISTLSRIHGNSVWSSLVFLLNGIIFMLIGLELPGIVAGLGDTDIWPAIGYGILITVVLVVSRLVASVAAVVVTMIMRNFITVADPNPPGWKSTLIMGWAGMRGDVSLAAALSIPLMLADGTPFPQRDLILFITFIVIFLTLVVQGLTLPVMIRKFDIPDRDFTRPEKDIEYEIRVELSKVAAEKLKTDYAAELKKYPALREQLQGYENRIKSVQVFVNQDDYRRIMLDVLQSQRQWLNRKNQDELLLDEEIVRRHLMLIDLQEERLPVE